MGKQKQKSSEVCLRDCNGACCRDLALPIKRPRTQTEINDMKWRLHFDTVELYILNRRWYMLVKGRCIYLDKNNRCTIYERRPEQCREHMPPECERFAPFYDVLLRTPEELDDYLAGRRKKRRRKAPLSQCRGARSAGG